MVDLSILEGINKATDQVDHNQEEKEGYNVKYRGLVGLDRDIERKKIELERITNVFENIKKSERLRCKINKDFIAAAPLEEILMDCLEVISLMTGDTVFYKQNKEYLKKMTSQKAV